MADEQSRQVAAARRRLEADAADQSTDVLAEAEEAARREGGRPILPAYAPKVPPTSGRLPDADTSGAVEALVGRGRGTQAAFFDAGNRAYDVRIGRLATIVSAATAAYFVFVADYGANKEHMFTPIRRYVRERVTEAFRHAQK